ncbi:hypothetical protein ACP70R_018328 [Stipagrostis hirtigluma subsp. patula]
MEHSSCTGSRGIITYRRRNKSTFTCQIGQSEQRDERNDAHIVYERRFRLPERKSRTN